MEGTLVFFCSVTCTAIELLISTKVQERPVAGEFRKSKAHVTVLSFKNVRSKNDTIEIYNNKAFPPHQVENTSLVREKKRYDKQKQMYLLDTEILPSLSSEVPSVKPYHWHLFSFC